MKKLPKVFENSIDKKLNNNKEFFISNNKKNKVNNNSNNFNNIYIKIKDIFSSYKFVYKANVIITTNEGEIKRIIIGKKDNNLITIDNELIDIACIKDIKFDE